ncbi:pyridoxal phosphate enzyme, YggS family [Thioflavicoccus mobilis 8321]|uniref:Pyridoxal phosphate homeostasis protein n=1 Tax=Thioflavicoccus mobilis 8321 TaxID=765912 RepID=L0GWB5_9GAMM|nr:YggS family pyridoxal phosphate-dependent enzyme [Thioflavicoccus mobilis]AGA89589.1 pyridoxal phosphate enzyme, YggS family [Thioflavicoccus mobilis 8321]
MTTPRPNDPPGEDATADIAARLQRVRAEIAAAERRHARPTRSVALLAVSKRQGPDKIRAAHAAGQRLFGESYLQEAIEKQAELAELDLEWHFIGRIQGNKTRAIAERFDWVHSLCELRHARRLAEQRPDGRPPLQVCIQVNLSSESSKGGLPPGAVAEFVNACEDLPRLAVRGLMTLPAPAGTLTEQRAPFRALRRLRDALATPARPLEVLSMGMSDDLEAAIAEGATLVRIGTAVFGPRPTA